MPCAPSACTCMQDARRVDLCARFRVQPVHAFEGPTVFLLAVRLLFFFFFFFNANQTSRCYKHDPAALPYVLTTMGLYLFDHLARIARTRYATGWLTAKHALNGGTMLVHVPSLRAGWHAGQHIWVRIVSNVWFGWWATWFLCRA